MEPYKRNNISYSYISSKDITKLLLDAREIYGEYKGFLKTMEFDYKHFLELMLINDNFYSFKIDNSKLSIDDMFYMPYKIKSNESLIFNNMHKVLLHAVAYFAKDKITIDTLNKMHKLMYLGCKKEANIKKCGHIRDNQTYILKPGIAGSSVSFIPPEPKNVSKLLKNLIEYTNTSEDPIVLSSIFHMEFERIHPYKTGNGKIGRLLIPAMYSVLKKEPPILFISESLYNLRNTYFTLLSNETEDDHIIFLKFILQCIVEQCNANIKKIKKLNKIYKNDYEALKNDIGGTTIYKVYPSIVKRIVFTTNDIIQDTSLHINSVNKVLNKLVEAKYLTKEKKKGTNRVTFRYNNMYDVFTK